jgi:pimeloyl-ACP methyl ester carboxylesterase
MGGFVGGGRAREHAGRGRPRGLGKNAPHDQKHPHDQRLVYWLKPERLLHRFGPRALQWGLRTEVRGSPIIHGALFEYLYAVMAQLSVIPSGGRAFDRWINLTGVHLTFERRLRELTMPVLLMWGDRDTTTPYSGALMAARTLGPGHLVALTGCGHAPFLDRPEDFARVLATWLESERVSTRV